MKEIMAIAGGGALGALARYGLSNGIHLFVSRDFPYGTMVVNVLGSLLMGFLYVLMIERFNMAPEWRALLLVGFLGAFTTFSTFSIETLNLIEQGEQLKALLNVFLSIILCLWGTWMGILAARQI